MYSPMICSTVVPSCKSQQERHGVLARDMLGTFKGHLMDILGVRDIIPKKCNDFSGNYGLPATPKGQCTKFAWTNEL